MKLIALTGAIASGKTAVAQELAKRGYLLISYTDLLKEIVAQALTSVGVPTTLDAILQDKEYYRPLIQEFGTVIGFDQGGVFMREALRIWEQEGSPAAVLDNIRTDQQAEAVTGYGFNVVRLDAHYETRANRLLSDGKDPEAVLSREFHHIESGVSTWWVDMEFDTNAATPDVIAEFLFSMPDAPVLPDDGVYSFEGHPDDVRTFEEMSNDE